MSLEKDGKHILFFKLVEYLEYFHVSVWSKFSLCYLHSNRLSFFVRDNVPRIIVLCYVFRTMNKIFKARII